MSYWGGGGLQLQKQTPPLGSQGGTGSLHMCLKWPGSIVRDAGSFRTIVWVAFAYKSQLVGGATAPASCENGATRFEPKARLEGA